MSTQINVTVDSGGLSDRAKQQQQAARQAQLEKQRTLNLSAEALDKRVAAKAAQGLSVDGQPLYGTSFKQPQIERRPAATRTGGIYELLLTPKPETAPGVFQADVKNAKIKPVIFTDYQSPPGHTYVSTGGPTGGAYLNCLDAASTLARGVSTTTEDLIFDITDPAANRVDFTVDCWVYIDGNSLILDNLVYPYEQVKTGRLTTDQTSDARMRLELQFDRRFPSYGPYTILSLKRRATYPGNFSRWITVFQYTDFDPSGSVTGSYPSELYVFSGGTLTPEFSPIILHSTWVHLAVVRQSGVLSFFINGSKMGFISEYTDAENYLEPLYDSGSLLSGASFPSGFDNRASNNRVANLRVRKKAVFTENFDPLLIS